MSSVTFSRYIGVDRNNVNDCKFCVARNHHAESSKSEMRKENYHRAEAHLIVIKALLAEGSVIEMRINIITRISDCRESA